MPHICKLLVERLGGRIWLASAARALLEAQAVSALNRIRRDSSALPARGSRLLRDRERLLGM